MTVTASEELFAPVGRDIELCYQTFGDPDDEPLLLVMGLGGPMTWWDAELCQLLADRGFYVVRYDNRDTGRSSRGPGRVTRATLVRAFAGRRVRAPYSLSDMAEDAFGLLDHLGLESAHVLRRVDGRDDRPDHGDRAPGAGALADQHHVHDRQAHGRLAAPEPAAEPAGPRAGREAYIESSVRTWRLIGSPGYPPARSASAPAPPRPGTGASPPAARCARCWPSSPSRTARRGCAR